MQQIFGADSASDCLCITILAELASVRRVPHNVGERRGHNLELWFKKLLTCFSHREFGRVVSQYLTYGLPSCSGAAF